MSDEGAREDGVEREDVEPEAAIEDVPIPVGMAASVETQTSITPVSSQDSVSGSTTGSLTGTASPTSSYYSTTSGSGSGSSVSSQASDSEEDGEEEEEDEEVGEGAAEGNDVWRVEAITALAHVVPDMDPAIIGERVDMLVERYVNHGPFRPVLRDIAINLFINRLFALGLVDPQAPNSLPSVSTASDSAHTPIALPQPNVPEPEVNNDEPPVPPQDNLHQLNVNIPEIPPIQPLFYLPDADPTESTESDDEEVPVPGAPEGAVVPAPQEPQVNADVAEPEVVPADPAVPLLQANVNVAEPEVVPADPAVPLLQANVNVAEPEVVPADPAVPLLQANVAGPEADQAGPEAPPPPPPVLVAPPAPVPVAAEPVPVPAVNPLVEAPPQVPVGRPAPKKPDPSKRRPKQKPKEEVMTYENTYNQLLMLAPHMSARALRKRLDSLMRSSRVKKDTVPFPMDIILYSYIRHYRMPKHREDPVQINRHNKDLMDTLHQITTIYENVDPRWVINIAKRGCDTAHVGSIITDNFRYIPKIAKNQHELGTEELTSDEELAYLKEPLTYRADEKYQEAATRRFSLEYPFISVKSLRAILGVYEFNYVPAFLALQKELRHPTWETRRKEERSRVTKYPCFSILVPKVRPLTTRKRLPWIPVRNLNLLVRPRVVHGWEAIGHPLLAQEMEWLDRRRNDGARIRRPRDYLPPPLYAPPCEGMADEKNYDPQKMAYHKALAEAREKAGDGEEPSFCNICMEQREGNEMIACLEGHTFCAECVHHQAKELVLAQGSGNLLCLARGCGAVFPRNLLREFIPHKLLTRMEKQQDEYSMVTAAAANPDIIRCQWCPYAAEVSVPPEVDKVFKCERPGCGRAFCRLCGRNWDDDHWGKDCDDFETDDEAAERLRREEALSAAIVRQCHNCNLPFEKVQGCNKITCTQCKATQCYLCRAKGIGYDHFCQHLRDGGVDGAECNQCNRCRLFVDAVAADAQRLIDIQRQHQAQEQANQPQEQANQPPPA